MTDPQEHPEPRRDAEQRTDEAPRLIDVDELFRGGREVWLELAGVRYRLRITRRNKLILHK